MFLQDGNELAEFDPQIMDITKIIIVINKQPDADTASIKLALHGCAEYGMFVLRLYITKLLNSSQILIIFNQFILIYVSIIFKIYF